MKRSAIALVMMGLATAVTGCGKDWAGMIEDAVDDETTAGTDASGTYESIAGYTVASHDSSLGYGAYPEDPTASSGYACVVEIPVETAEGTAFSITSTTISGALTEPGHVAITPPSSTGLTGAKINPSPGWSGTTHHFDGTVVPRGTWVATLPFPDPAFLSANAGDEPALLGECLSAYGALTLSFAWTEAPAPSPQPPSASSGQHCQAGSATSKLVPWRVRNSNLLSAFPWVMAGSQGAVGNARLTSARVITPGHVGSVSIMAEDGTRVFLPLSGAVRNMDRTAWVGGDWRLDITNVPAGVTAQLPDIEYSWTCVADPGSFGRPKGYVLTVPDFAQQILVRVAHDLRGRPILMFEPRGRPERADSVLMVPAGPDRYTVAARLHGFDMQGTVEVRAQGLRLDGTFGFPARAIHQTLPPFNAE